ncbi:MAG: lysostaphin resistance A-like protein [Saprospiraceae bacterium]
MEIDNALNSEVIDTVVLPEADTITPLSFGRGLWMGIQFLLIQIVALIPVAILGFIIYGVDNQEGMNNLIMFLGLPLAFLAGAWYFYKKRGLIDTAFAWKSNFPLLIIIGLFLMYGVNYLVGEFMTYLPGYDAMLEMYQEMFAGMNPMALLLGGALIGPICEEIIFRGVILEGLAKKYDPTKAIIFSALIFGIIHLQPLQVIGAFFAGLILGWIYLKTQSLWVVIALHVINNFVAFTFSDLGTESTRELIGNDLLYAGSFVVSAAIAYGAYLAFNKFNKSEAPVTKYV